MLKLQLETSFYGCNPQTFQDYDLISISLKTILHTYLLITYLLVLTSLANKAVTKVLNHCLSLASVWSMSKLHLYLFFFLASLFCFPSGVLERAARVPFKYITKSILMSSDKEFGEILIMSNPDLRCYWAKIS